MRLPWHLKIHKQQVVKKCQGRRKGRTEEKSITDSCINSYCDTDLGNVVSRLCAPIFTACFCLQIVVVLCWLVGNCCFSVLLCR